MLFVPCSDVRYDFRINTMFGSSLPLGVCMGRMSYLRYIVGVFFAESGVQHILCCAFFLYLSSTCVLCTSVPLVPVSLDCPFFITSSVFSNVYLQVQLLTIGMDYF